MESPSSHVVCDKRSGWSTLPTCSKVPCGNPVVPLNGRLVLISGTSFQSVARFECLSSYNAYGEKLSMCLSDGTWSKSLTCVKPGKDNIY